MVADYDFQAFRAGIFHLFDGLDPAVQGNEQLEAVVGGPVYAFVREAVTLVIAVRNIKVGAFGKAMDEGVHKRHGRGAVHIVIPVDQNLFSLYDGPVKAFNRLVHIGHQERVVEVFQARAEEAAGLLEALYAALHEQVGQNPVYPELGRKLCRPAFIGRRLHFPLSFHAVHSLTKIEIPSHFCKRSPYLPYLLLWRAIGCGKCAQNQSADYHIFVRYRLSDGG